MLKKALTVTVFLTITAGCDWVDSTGVQSDSPPAILLDEGVVVPLIEGENRTLILGDPFNTSESEFILTWGDVPLQEGPLPGCASVENYAADIAAPSLAQACYDEDACRIDFQAVTVSNEAGEQSTAFELEPPVLKAPVGLTYQLISTGPDGLNSQANFTFCLIAENDPPVANDDIYTVIESESLVISSAGMNLLSNDIDDTDSDVRNKPLSVLVPAYSVPTLADSFELFADGSFSYTPNAAIQLEPGTSLTDIFEYEITDGTYTDRARVQINIGLDDLPPLLLEPIPDSEAIVGIKNTISLSEYFNDPEGGDLTYVVNAASLPPSRNFTVTTAGVLSGTAEPQDVGEWTLLVSATDVKGQSVASDFVLSIIDNLPPESQVIPAQTANTDEVFMLDTSLYFNDPEGIELSYSLTGASDESIAIDRVSGTISGFFSSAATYELTVSVSDGVNQPVFESFTVTVTSKLNQSPTHSGLIANQSVEVNQPIQEIKGNFVDPDGDPLVFSMQGVLPPGVVLSAQTGVISGIPTAVRVYRNLRIRATDPEGAFALSDNFTITVTAATPNRKPVYAGLIGNQSITLGSAIAAIEGNFSDPDGDPLAYSVVGTLPAGLTLSQDGVLTGRPLSVTTAPANLRLRATDPDGLSVQSDLFRITVAAAPPATVNQRPEYIGSIRDRIVSIGNEILPIKGAFSDPDGDRLSYRVVGTLPVGVTLNAVTGSITGIPTEEGTSADLRIVATDTGDLTASSDRFTITVR